MEGVLILLGILWLLGIFRGFVIPVTVKHEVTLKKTSSSEGFAKEETKNQKPETLSKGQYGIQDAEDIDFEEIK